MNSRVCLSLWRGLLGPLPVLLVWTASPTAAQGDLPLLSPPSQDSPLLRDLSLWTLLTPAQEPVGQRFPRVPVFRMPSSFPFDPAVLDPDSNNPPSDPDGSMAPPTGDNSNIQLALGADYPFLDFRRQGTPGGIGYLMVHAEVPLFTSVNTECSLNCRAVTPGGPENNGLEEGPTCLSPNLTLFQELGEGTALQGFFGKDWRANSACARDWVTACSMAWLCSSP